MVKFEILFCKECEVSNSWCLLSSQHNKAIVELAICCNFEECFIKTFEQADSSVSGMDASPVVLLSLVAKVYCTAGDIKILHSSKEEGWVHSYTR